LDPLSISAEADQPDEIKRIFAMAVETLGDVPRATCWMETKNHALEGQAPRQRMRTPTVAMAVETLLGRTAQGLYS
jgi:uncharacterized protein (DUF2384 family)